MLRERGISRKVCAIVCSIVMALSLFATGVNLDTIVAKADGVVTATITYTAQFDGSFKDVKVRADVSSDTAEKYGYNDPVSQSDGVSMLDVLVQIHKDIFPEFSAGNRDEYLTVADNYGYGLGVDTNIFKKGGAACGYYKNHISPNNLEVKVANNDVVEFFYYQDAGYSDSYTLFKDVTFEDGYLSGKLFRQWGWPTQEEPVSNVELGFVNPDTLEIVPVSPYGATKTSADGSFEVSMPSTSINYILTVLEGTYEGTPLVRGLCDDYTTASQVDMSPKSMDEKQNIYNLAGKYLADNNKSISYGDSKEGYLLGLGRAGYPVDAGLYSGYYDSVKNYLASHNNRFESVSECAKVVIALNAIGYDPTNINGVDITQQLNETSDPDSVWEYAYALIALDSKNYNSSARDAYLNKLLTAQLDSGAWGWNETAADIDTTGMVLAALAPYYNSNSSVKAAVDKSLNYLSASQMPDGAFASGMNENANSTAMVVLALSELGIDAGTDLRFKKNGISVVDALSSFAVEGGGFGWIDNVEVNDYATYQAYYALCSYFRHINGMNRLFDMTPEKNIVAATTSNKVTSVPKTGDRFLRFL